MSTVTLGGNPVQVDGQFPKARQAAPAFTIWAFASRSACENAAREAGEKSDA